MISVLTIKNRDGEVLSVEVGETDELYQHFLAQLKAMPRGTKFQMNHLRTEDDAATEDGAR